MRILGALAGVLIVTAGFAQDKEPTFSVDVNEATFSVDVNVVNIFATVRDSDGRIVKDLTKEDFVLKEQGKVQEIKYFARQTDLPLTIGLLVDISGSQINLIESERRASYQFLNQVLRPEKDLTFVIKFAKEVELIQDLTGSREKLQQALNELGAPYSNPTPSRRRRPRFFSFQGWPGGGARIPGGTGWPGGGTGWPGGQYPVPGGSPPGFPPNTSNGTSLNDAVFLASDEVLRGKDGRKAIILISDGVDTTSMLSLREAIESSQRSDVIVYSIQYYDPEAYGGGHHGGTWGGGGSGSLGASTLESISNKTGGRMFEARDEQSLEYVFDQIEEELRNQYNIGYSSDTAKDGSFRKIKLTTKKRKLRVQTREGYYPES